MAHNDKLYIFLFVSQPMKVLDWNMQRKQQYCAKQDHAQNGTLHGGKENSLLKGTFFTTTK